MTYAFVGRISRAYSDISRLIIDWSQQSDFLWVYQHDSDESVSRTHCHILVINSQRDAEGLKKLVSWKQHNFKGNTDSSFKMYNKIHDHEHQGLWYEYLKYSSKGNLKPVFAHGENAEAIANESLAHWELRTNSDTHSDVIVSSCKQKRVTQFDIARMAQSAYMDKYTEEIMGKTHLEFNVVKLVKIITTLLRANRMCANYRVVAGIVQDIQVELSPDRFISKIISMV